MLGKLYLQTVGPFLLERRPGGEFGGWLKGRIVLKCGGPEVLNQV